MIRRITAVILFLVMLAASFYIDSQIKAHNMDYYSGKDNGAFAQLESILIFGFIYYLLISSERKILHGCLGLIVGLFSGIVAYLIFGANILYPLFASTLIVVVFYLLDKYLRRRSENKPTVDER